MSAKGVACLVHLEAPTKWSYKLYPSHPSRFSCISLISPVVHINLKDVLSGLANLDLELGDPTWNQTHMEPKSVQ